MKIRYRILLPTLIFFLVVEISFAYLFKYLLIQSVKAEFQRNAKTAEKIIQNHIREISREALSIAATLAAFPAVRDAYRLLEQTPQDASPAERAVYLKDTQNFLRGWMLPILKEIRKASKVQEDIKIHFHFPPAMSLLRLWQPPGDHDGGDDLGTIRPSVLKVNQAHVPLLGLEAGKFGIFIRGIASIDDHGDHLGSVECFFPLNRITTIFRGIPSEALTIYTLKNFAFSPTSTSQAAKIGNYIKIFSSGSSRFDSLITERFLAAGIKGTISRFTAFKGLAAFPLKDITGKNIGVIVYGKDYKERLSTFRRIVFGIIALFTAAFVILTAILIFTERSITRPISVITDALNQLATRGTANLSYRLKANRKDEIGAIAVAFNRLMEEMDELKHFKKVIEDDETLSEVYQRLALLLKTKLNLTTFTIYEVNNSKNHLIPVIIEGHQNGGLWCKKDILTNANHCRAKRTSKEVLGDKDPFICPMFSGNQDFAYLCIPLITGEATSTILQVLVPKDKENLIHENIERLRTYLSECTPVIGSKRLVGLLKDTSTRDELTGLLNRRFLNDAVETLIPGILRRETHLGILMADIDFFKQVNDTYGHEKGDEVLKKFAEILRENVRLSDVVVRYGGEEFLILLVDMDKEVVTALAEKIRLAVESFSFTVPGGILKKTVSIGISIFPDHTENFWQSVKFADVALYKAKESGRNKVILFEKGMWDESGEY